MKPFIKHLLMLLLSAGFLAADIGTGTAVPQLIFQTSGGKLVFINDYVGEPRILNSDAERVPVTLVFFRSEESRVADWLGALAADARKSKLKMLFIAVDEDGSALLQHMKEKQLRGTFLIDRYGRSAESLSLTPLSRFGNAPTALCVRRNGEVVRVFSNFGVADVKDIISTAASLLNE